MSQASQTERPRPLSTSDRDALIALIGGTKPATTGLVAHLAKAVHDVREHEHPKWEDLYCLNLTSFMGERMGPVLRRLIDAETENEELRARVAELEAQRERRRVRLVALQNDALNMRGTLSPNGEARKVPMPLGETLTPAVEWLVNRVAELEAGPIPYFHASHESIVFGRYRNKDAARLHCDTLMLREQPTAVLDWIEDEEDGVDELVATVGGKEIVTGYVVTASTIDSGYDAEADRQDLTPGGAR
ncbi:hypothetical protein ACFWCA_32555 [Streptomyces phaeochromogenes]|uniref:hypothetical protein n=1 Tax=Streptomyces phaeochromogenes TaxID=1923 RepID=UPI0036C0A502